MTTLAPPRRTTSAVCEVPIDSQFFDESSVAPLPQVGAELVLASFELPTGYCGLLEYFSQFTDEQSANAANVSTPGLQWQLLVNRQPLAPYLNLEHIVNPWGVGSFPLAVRLPESARLEFVLRRSTRSRNTNVESVGGRIMGRYWYRGQ